MKADKLAKDLQEDKEYLKHCLELKSQYHEFYLKAGHKPAWSEDWWASDDTVLTVARILECWGQFTERTDVIDYFEKPYNFEDKMKFIVENM